MFLPKVTNALLALHLCKHKENKARLGITGRLVARRRVMAQGRRGKDGAEIRALPLP